MIDPWFPLPCPSLRGSVVSRKHPWQSRVFIIVIIYKPAVHIIGCAIVTARHTNGTKGERREGRIGVRAVAPGCSPMDSRTVVGDRSRCIARAMRRIALLWCTSAIRSVTRARRSASSISLSFRSLCLAGLARLPPNCPKLLASFVFPSYAAWLSAVPCHFYLSP